MHGNALGMHSGRYEIGLGGIIARYVRMGVRFILAGSDLFFMMLAAGNRTATVRRDPEYCAASTSNRVPKRGVTQTIKRYRVLRLVGWDGNNGP